MRTVQLPSVVGVGDTNIGQLSLGVLGRGRARPELPHQVRWQTGAPYLVGTGVESYTRAVERMDFLRLADGPELRALTYTALGLLLGTGHYTTAIVVGLPVEVMADNDLAKATLRDLRRWLVNTHTFTVDEVSTQLEISQVQVMAQPAGAFFAWGLNNAGSWTRSTDDLKAQVGICDLGFNTLDLFTVQAGQVVARFTGGDTAGMRRAAEIIVQAVRQQYGVTYSLHQADALLQERQPKLHTAGQTIDLSTLVDQARAAAAGAVIAFLESRWGNGRQFGHLLFTGGGAAALREPLLAQYPYGEVLAEPVTANALGLARYARRAFKDTSLVIGLDPGFGGFKVVSLDC